MLYDARGRCVAVLQRGALGAGTHRLRLDGTALPGGTYAVCAVVQGHEHTGAASGATILTRRLTLAC